MERDKGGTKPQKNSTPQMALPKVLDLVGYFPVRVFKVFLTEVVDNVGDASPGGGREAGHIPLYSADCLHRPHAPGFPTIFQM